jgi:hypothetical protein
MKNSNDTTGNRTRDLPTFSAVPQPTSLPRVPILEDVSTRMHGTENLKERTVTYSRREIIFTKHLLVWARSINVIELPQMCFDMEHSDGRKGMHKSCITHLRHVQRVRSA